MYHSGRNPLKPVRRIGSEEVAGIRGGRQRRLHKAFLRWHDPENWPLLREALKRMGRADLIGPGQHQLVPGGFLPPAADAAPSRPFRTRHAGPGRSGRPGRG
jgi:hypothetical protein